MIITLCGSTRFEAGYHYWNERLSLEGNIVLSLSVFPSTKTEREWYTPDIKQQLDWLHIKKISMSDIAFIIDCASITNMERYVGESTKREIDFATSINMAVIYAYDVFMSRPGPTLEIMGRP